MEVGWIRRIQVLDMAYWGLLGVGTKARIRRILLDGYGVLVFRTDTYEIYGRLNDAQDDRLLMSGQLNLLRRDRRAHARTARLMEAEARASREAWVKSMDASDTTCYETQMAAL
ncbi:hypothetical protein Tco_1443958, partial [Tanacetum coccineum]